MKKLFSILFVIVFFIIAFFAFQWKSSQYTVPSDVQLAVGEPTPAERTIIDDRTIPAAERSSEAAETKVFDMTAKQWAFEPDTIRVSQDDTVIINVTSVDVTHGIQIEGYEVSANLEPGKTVSLKFVADTKGTYKFWCNVYCGAGHGDMKGTIIVE